MPRGPKLTSHEFVKQSVKYLASLSPGHATHLLEQIESEVGSASASPKRVVKRRKRRTAEEIAADEAKEATPAPRKTSGSDKPRAAKPTSVPRAVPRARRPAASEEATAE